MPRRLFLFAAFDGDGVAGPSLILYLRALSSCGDVVLASDCSFGEEDRARLDDFCLHTDCAAHHEYDFGSYKRAWIWAAENLDLPEYDYVYLVNDSIFGGNIRPEAITFNISFNCFRIFTITLNI